MLDNQLSQNRMQKDIEFADKMNQMAAAKQRHEMQRQQDSQMR